MSADAARAESAVSGPVDVGPIDPDVARTGPANADLMAADRVDAARASTELTHPEPVRAGSRLGLIRRTLRRQEVGYALVGGFNTVFGIALTVAWLTVLPDTAWAPSAAVALAYAVSVVVAFALHRRLVFRVRGRVLRDFLGFVVVNSGGLVLNMALLSLAVTVLGLPKAPSTVVVMGLVAIAGFFGHRHISFRRRPVDEAGGVVR